METLETINWRASLKGHISSREIEEDKIQKILEAGRMAPSARNSQPWRFIVVRDKKTIESMADSLFVGPMLKDVPVILIAFANPGDDIVRDGKEYYLFDVALAVENMVLAATDLGLVTHLIASANEDALKEALGVPDEVRFVIATPLAYPAAASYEEAAKERLTQRTRKSLPEIAYADTWAKPF